MGNGRILSLLVAFGVISISKSQVPPAITKHPYSIHPIDYLYRYNGDETESQRYIGTYRCQANGSPPITYTWYYGKRKDDKYKTPPVWLSDYTNIKKSDKDRNATGGELKIPDWTRRLEGFYRCKAKNTYGIAISNAIELINSVKHRFPKFDQRKSVIVNATEGEYSRIKCKERPETIPEPIYTWEGTTKMTEDKFLVTDQNGDLHILKVQSKYSKEVLTCTLSSTDGKLTASGEDVQLNVIRTKVPTKKRAPKIVFTSAMKTDYKGNKIGIPTYVRQKSTLRLQCIPSGNPLPTVTWKHNDNPINGRERIIFSHKFKYTLEVEKVQASDAGNYTCYLKDHPHIKKTMRVVVRMAPIPSERPTSVILITTSTKEFSCEGYNPGGINEAVVVSWLINGSNVEGSSKGIKIIKKPANKLIVSKARKEYHRMAATCILRNRFRDRWLGFTVNVIDKPKIVNKSTGRVGDEIDLDPSMSVLYMSKYNKSFPLTINIQTEVKVDDLVKKDLEIKWFFNHKVITNTNKETAVYTHLENKKLLTIHVTNHAVLKGVLGKYKMQIDVPYVKGALSVMELLAVKGKANDKDSETNPFVTHNRYNFIIWLVIGLVGLLLFVLLIVLLLYKRRRSSTILLDQKGEGSGEIGPSKDQFGKDSSKDEEKSENSSQGSGSSAGRKKKKGGGRTTQLPLKYTDDDGDNLADSSEKSGKRDMSGASSAASASTSKKKGKRKGKKKTPTEELTGDKANKDGEKGLVVRSQSATQTNPYFSPSSDRYNQAWDPDGYGGSMRSGPSVIIAIAPAKSQ